MDPVVALEIGTAKVIAMVGEMREDRTIMVTGFGQASSVGVRKGEIIDLENATVCIKRALEDAEKTSSVQMGEVYLCTSAGHIRGVKNQGTTQILGENGEVTEEDMEDVADIARAVVLPDDRQVIHTIHGHYSIDGQERVVRPEGMVGHQLRLDMLILHGVKTLLDNSSWAVEQLAYNVGDIAFGGLCSALAVLTAEQKHSGVVVIDLGCGTTDYMAYDDGFAVCGGSLGVGGDHVTNDIQQAFSIQRKRAENLKCEHGSAVVGSAHEQAQVSLPAEVGFSQTSINVRTLQVVINARLREIFEMIKKQLDAEEILPVLGAGIVLTGGGAHMDGVVDLAREVFKAPCSIGIPRGISGIPKITDGPEYAACCGLLRYGFKVQERMQYESGSFLGGLVGRLLGRN